MTVSPIAQLAYVGAAVAAGLVLAEVCLRLMRPEGPPAPRRDRGADAIRLDERLGYETVPHGTLAVIERAGVSVALRANGEGFLGADRPRNRSEGVVRIIAVGDSVVEGLFGLQDPHEFGGWPAGLERLLNERIQDGRSFEVINAGVGGYTAWQTARRFESRGTAFRPDVVVALVGWNDLALSARSDWHPFCHFYEFEPLPGALPRGWGVQVKEVLLAHSYLARMARDLRRSVRPSQAARVAQSIPFNEAALAQYVESLEQLRAASAAAGACLALVLWPTPLLADPASTADATRAVGPSVPLSAGELLRWYDRYVEAQADLARRHPEVTLIDPRDRFGPAGAGAPADRWFADLTHLTPAGNAVLAEAVLAGLLPLISPPNPRN